MNYAMRAYFVGRLPVPPSGLVTGVVTRPGVGGRTADSTASAALRASVYPSRSRPSDPQPASYLASSERADTIA